MTRAPSRAIIAAVARPIPKAAPATIATLPANLAMTVLRGCSFILRSRPQSRSAPVTVAAAWNHGLPQPAAERARRQDSIARQKFHVVDQDIGQSALQERPVLAQVARPEHAAVGPGENRGNGKFEIRRQGMNPEVGGEIAVNIDPRRAAVGGHPGLSP